MKPPYKEGEPSFVHFLKFPKIILDLFSLYLLILYFLFTIRSRPFDFFWRQTWVDLEKKFHGDWSREKICHAKSLMHCQKKILVRETTHPPHTLTLQNSNGPSLVHPFYPIKLCRFIVLDFTWDIPMSHDIANNDYAKFCAAQASR